MTTHQRTALTVVLRTRAAAAAKPSPERSEAFSEALREYGRAWRFPDWPEDRLEVHALKMSGYQRDPWDRQRCLRRWDERQAA